MYVQRHDYYCICIQGKAWGPIRWIVLPIDELACTQICDMLLIDRQGICKRQPFMSSSHCIIYMYIDVYAYT